MRVIKKDQTADALVIAVGFWERDKLAYIPFVVAVSAFFYVIVINDAGNPTVGYKTVAALFLSVFAVFGVYHILWSALHRRVVAIDKLLGKVSIAEATVFSARPIVRSLSEFNRINICIEWKRRGKGYRKYQVIHFGGRSSDSLELLATDDDSGGEIADDIARFTSLTIFDATTGAQATENTNQSPPKPAITRSNFDVQNGYCEFTIPPRKTRRDSIRDFLSLCAFLLFFFAVMVVFEFSRSDPHKLPLDKLIGISVVIFGFFALLSGLIVFVQNSAYQVCIVRFSADGLKVAYKLGERRIARCTVIAQSDFVTLRVESVEDEFLLIAYSSRRDTDDREVTAQFGRGLPVDELYWMCHLILTAMNTPKE